MTQLCRCPSPDATDDERAEAMMAGKILDLSFVAALVRMTWR
ncbi:MAG: hypothetical protein ACRDTF_11560 [Pseudonocardiaceae bacterium]